MSFVHIKKQTRTGEHGPVEVYLVPAMALNSPEGKRLIPNPAGKQACVFSTLEEAQQAVRLAGFDFIYEGRKTYTLEPGYGRKPLAADNDILQQAVPLLLERLNDKEPTVLANAIFALGELAADAAIPALIEHLGHDDPNIRKHLAEAFAKFGGTGLSSLQQAYRNALKSREKQAAYIRLTVMQAYLEICRTQIDWVHAVLPQAIEALADENWLVRAQAALVVGHAAEYLKQP